MNAIIPFEIKFRPIKKLVIIDLKDDERYKCLELQLFDGNPYGKGYRILGTRHDRYLDVYNDVSLNKVPNEKINEVEKGAAEWRDVDLKGTIFEDTEKGLRVYFSFKDIYGRDIVIDLEENRGTPTKNMSLLGPTVAGSENPLFLPLFWVKRFDFLYQKGTMVKSTVDGKPLQLAKPPAFPKDGQNRFFVKYSMESYIIDFAPQQQGTLSAYSLDDDNTVEIGSTKYHFVEREKEILLTSVEINVRDAMFKFCINDGLPVSDGEDIDFKTNFKFCGPKEFGIVEGYISGERKAHQLELELCADKGWKAAPVTIWDYMIMNRFTMHAKWPKSFYYSQKIDLLSCITKAEWKRVKTNDVRQ